MPKESKSKPPIENLPASATNSGVAVGTRWAEKGRPAARPEDLEGYAENYRNAHEALLAGKYVVLWGTEIGDDPREIWDRIIAYEKVAMESVGWVLMADGSGVNMLPGEIKRWRETTPILHQIGRLYLAYQRDQRRPPSCLEDLEPYAKKFATGLAATRDGTWIVRWKTEITGDPNEDSRRVLAYERTVIPGRQDGTDWAVMGDNRGRQITAYELEQLTRTK